MSHKRHGEPHQAPPANPGERVQGDGEIRQEIELRAYYRYCERGCAPGGEREDWLAAEQEVLAKHRTAATQSA